MSDTFKYTYNPKKIMTGVTSFSSSGIDGHQAAIRKDGSLWVWGNNKSGQLGDGTYISRIQPKKIMTGVKTVRLYRNRSAVIKKNGSLWVWGNNGNGELGFKKNKTINKPKKLM